MKTTTQDALAQILNAAELASDDTLDCRDIKVGAAVRQGDVYLVRVDKAKHGERLATMQLVDGTSPGSRHVATPPAVLHESTGQRPSGSGEVCLLGPVVLAPSEWTLTHPEHADLILPGGSYLVTHQLDATTHERVQD